MVEGFEINRCHSRLRAYAERDLGWIRSVWAVFDSSMVRIVRADPLPLGDRFHYCGSPIRRNIS